MTTLASPRCSSIAPGTSWSGATTRPAGAISWPATCPCRRALRAERELLAPLRRWADVLIDTTRFLHQRPEADDSRAVRTQTAPQQMTVTVSSFGFARGMPPTADLVFDMRFLDNPHWEAGLREQTGLDAARRRAYRAQTRYSPPAFDKIRDLLLELLPRYAAQGKATSTSLSAAPAGGTARFTRRRRWRRPCARRGFSPTVLHRNLGSRAADLVEGKPAPVTIAASLSTAHALRAAKSITAS